ncbi:hypothetical protein D3C81_2237180 [compost metagenome]
MAIVFVMFLLIILIEWIYLKYHRRKLRTFIIVYGVMFFSLICNLAMVADGKRLNPNLIIKAILQK